MNCIILHGSGKNDEEKIKAGFPTQDKRHWIPWIKKKLEEKGIKTFTPLLPKSSAPLYEEWKEEFEKLPLDEETILIGHSAGGAFLVRWLDETKKKVKKLVLVSPGKSGKESRKSLSDLYGDKKYKNIKDYVKEPIIIFTADDDMEYHIENAYEYKEELPAVVILLGKGFGHFTEKGMGTNEFPELLKEVLK